MIVFWGTAIGGIATAITWARMKGRNPARRDVIVKSLKKRLEEGELTQEKFDRKLAELHDRNGTS
jgi:putative membrane protein